MQGLNTLANRSAGSPRPATDRRFPSKALYSAAGLLLLLAASILPLIAAADLPGEAHGTVAAVFPPGTREATAVAAIAEADGLLVRSGGWSTVLVVRSDRAGFARRLRQAGAWLVLDPQSAAGCLVVD